MSVHPGALRLVSDGLARSIRMAAPVPFDIWLQSNIVLVDGPKKGELWSPEDAPYLIEIAKCLSQEHPCNEVTVRKSQQTGVSILGLAWMLYIAETCPDNCLYGVPGLDSLQDINSGKLQPLIDAWQLKTGKQVIAPTTSRSGVGSTTYEKKFAGGSIYLANANTVMDLSAKTTRFGVKDEVSKWQTLTNDADPENLFFGRFTAFRRQKTFKIFSLSTPELDSGDPLGDGPGHCRIDRDFRRSDQRFWHIACPECATLQVQHDANLIVDRKSPHKTVMRCMHCTHNISEMERVVAVRNGSYVPTFTEPDRHPGFHVDAFMSLMMSYEAIAEDKINYESKGEVGAKDYANLVCALPYQMKGNAPDHQRLMERRENYPAGVIQPGGLIFTAGADVQGYGIYCEGVCYAEDRQSWNVFAEFFEGATDHPSRGAFAKLREYYLQEFPDSFGVLRPLDLLVIDAGYRTNTVLEFARSNPNVIAIKGMTGRGVPAISPPTRRSVTRSGKRKKYGSTLSWPVGTWPLKAEFYGNLHRQGMKAGEAEDPSGYCHFHEGLSEEYFKQITAEYFTQKLVKGKMHEEWAQRRADNHFLDCRIYSMAGAEHLGLTRLTKEQWMALREKLEPSAPIDLLSPAPMRLQLEQRSEPSATATKQEPAPVARENRWKKRR